MSTAPEGKHSVHEEMPNVHCYKEEEGNLNTAAQALLLGDNQKADAIDCDLQQMFHMTVTAVENHSDADCLLQQLYSSWVMYLLAILQMILGWQVTHYVIVGISIIPLHSGTLHDITSHLAGSMVSKGLKILQEVKHREETSFTPFSS